MSNNFLKTSVEYLKGVGPERGKLLREELTIDNLEDLLSFYPYRYIDRSRFFKVRDITPDMAYVQLKGYISNIQSHGQRRITRMTAYFADDTGRIELVWFKGFKWLKNAFNPGVEYIVFGKPTQYGTKINIAHPEIEKAEEWRISQSSSMKPMYSSSEKLKNKGLDSKGINKIIRNLIEDTRLSIEEKLPSTILDELKLINSHEAFINIHFPKDQNLLNRAKTRLKFEELFFIQLNLLRHKKLRTEKARGVVFERVGDFFNKYYNDVLAFELTKAQKRVIKEIRQDLKSGKQMNRLLQGDVGSGKTVVALMSMLLAIDNGYQACLMAPTEVLAQQHYATISESLKDIDVNVGLLTGSTKNSERKTILEELVSGKLHLLIGTHALIEEVVKFKNLGFVVIDEQHRFGVAQRAKLWYKNQISPHVLVMTATPIPRTLAMTVYGDLDVSVIDELPPGRKPVKTIHQYDTNRLKVFGFIRDQINKGRQAYIVYPLIEESKKLDLKDLKDGYESVVRAFPMPEYSVSIVHGQMKPADKNYEMNRFAKGETDIMVSTTVIEVGVDIPNASVMIIENAERFGLSQLHQLRGRVGRGADQSYCVLMTGYKLTNDAKQRIKTMVETNDGFKIAETDLKLRGPGDIEGTKQSGILELKISDIVKDEKILKIARNKAVKIIEDDPMLEKPQNYPLRKRYEELYLTKKTWSKIS